MAFPKPWNDQQMDQIIGMILRGGVLLSALVVLTGGVFYLRHYGFNVPEYGIFQGEPADLRNISGILQDTLAFGTGGSSNSVYCC